MEGTKLVLTPEERKARKNALNVAWRALPENRERRRLATATYRAENKERVHLSQVAYRANPEKKERDRITRAAYLARPEVVERIRNMTRRWAFRRKYGATLEQVEQMAVSQNHACAICFRVLPLVVDHNHTTGKIRALLCGPCNTAIGLLQESLTVLESAKSYLQKHTIQ